MNSEISGNIDKYYNFRSRVRFMRIAGIYPCDVELDPKIQHAVSEPYGLEMILAIAKKEGHDVELFMPFKEANGKVVGTSEEDMVERILDYEPDIAAYSMFTCQYPMGKRIAQELKKENKRIINVAGNRYPSYLYQKRDIEGLINEPFDFFVSGEGEEIFRELLNEMGGNQDYEKIRGIGMNRGDNIMLTPTRERNFNLDELPNALRFPIILNQSYKGISIPSLSENPGYAIVESSRGCFYTCKFCDVPGFYGNKMTFRSPQRVVDELFELRDKVADIFYFMDMNFCASPKHAFQLCEEMIKRKLNVNWYCMSNVASVDGKWELLDIMKEAGCYKIAWGIESTNDDSLKKMQKGVNDDILTSEQAIRVLDKSIQAGIINQGYYIIGFPWENEEDILNNADKLREIPLHQLNIGIFTPIPLSRLRYEMSKEGYEFDSDLEKHDRNHLIFNHKYLSGERIKELQKKVYDDFYETSEFIGRVRKSCKIDPRYEKAFNDYFEFLGKNARVNNGLRMEVVAQ